MGNFKDSIQPATKLETKHVTVYTSIGLVLMWLCFFLYDVVFKDHVLDYTVFLGGIGGGIVAVANFFLMAITVQKVATTEDDKDARSIMQASYKRRMLMQVLWIVIVLLVPCFQWVAGVLPLMFPSAGIKVKGILDLKKYQRQEVEQKQDGD